MELWLGERVATPPFAEPHRRLFAASLDFCIICCKINFAMTTNEPMGGLERLRQPARLVAAHEIAEAERDASAARALLDGDAFARLSRQERIRHQAVHQAFYELVEIQGTAAEEASIVLELFAENPEIANATLERIEMNGEWSAADNFERGIMGQLYDVGYKEMHRLHRQHPEAKIGVIIPAGFTREHGFVALRRMRRLIIAGHTDGRKAVRPALQVDKVSTFALDIDRLANLSDEAAAEVRLIVAATMFKAINWDVVRRGMGEFDSSLPQDLALLGRSLQGLPSDESDVFHAAVEDLYNLAGIMRHYNMSIDEVQQQAFGVERPSQLVGTEGLEFVEQSIHDRSELLTPAATTYYVH